MTTTTEATFALVEGRRILTPAGADQLASALAEPGTGYVPLGDVLRTALDIDDPEDPQQAKAWAVDRKTVGRFRDSVVVIGQAQGPNGDWPCFFGGSAGRRMSKLAGFTGPMGWMGIVRRTERVNLIPYYPGKAKSGGGDAFPMSEAQNNARVLLPLLRGRRVIFVGAKVEAAFFGGDPDRDHGHGWCCAREFDVGDHPEWHARIRRVLGDDGDDLRYWSPSQIPNSTLFAAATFPHPSGLNRFWNHKEAALTAARFLTTAVGGPS